MQVKGMFSRKMLRRGKFWTNHFEENSFAFLESVEEGATNQVNLAFLFFLFLVSFA